MIGAMSGGDGLGSAASAYFTQQLQGANSLTPLASLTGGGGGGGASPISTSISGPGQLFSDLQQLQAQNPAAFQQVTSQIATQLQAAAQQTQGPQSDYLSNLAAKFQNISSGGSLSQLQPKHHHHHHAQQADSESSQSQPQGIEALLQATASQSSGSQSSSNSNLQQLFTAFTAQQAYGQTSQSQNQGIAGLAAASGSQSPGSSTLQQLFATISTEVTQALAS
jgi:hypothetical protein